MSVFLCIETYVIFEYVENISGESQKLSIAWNLEIWDSRGKRGLNFHSLNFVHVCIFSIFKYICKFQ